MLRDLGDHPVAPLQQLLPEGLREGLAAAQGQAVGQEKVPGQQAVHQGRHRRHQDALAQVRQGH